MIIKACFGLIVRLRLHQWPTWQSVCVCACACRLSVYTTPVSPARSPSMALLLLESKVPHNLFSDLFLLLVCSEKHTFPSRQWKEQSTVLQHWHWDKMFSKQTSASSRAPQSAATGGGNSRGASAVLSWRDGDGFGEGVGVGVGRGVTSEVPDSLCFSWTAHKASWIPCELLRMYFCRRGRWSQS